MAISFTQFLRPNGKQRAMVVGRSDEIETQAQALVDAGFSFEIEELLTGKINMDCMRPSGEDAIASELVDNGPQVLDAVDRLVRSAYIRYKLKV